MKYESSEDVIKTMIWLEKLGPVIYEKFTKKLEDEGLEIIKKYMIGSPDSFIDARFKIKRKEDTDDKAVDFSFRNLIDDIIFEDRRAKKLKAKTVITSLEIDNAIENVVKFIKILTEITTEGVEGQNITKVLKKKLRGMNIEFRVAVSEKGKGIKRPRGRWAKPEPKKISKKEKLNE